MDTGADADIRIYPMLKSSTLGYVVGAEYPFHRLFPTFLIVGAVLALSERCASSYHHGAFGPIASISRLAGDGIRKPEGGEAAAPTVLVVGLTINLKLV